MSCDDKVAYRKKYREENREKIREYMRVYHEKNKERLNKYRREYRAKNREKYNGYMRTYHKSNYVRKPSKEEFIPSSSHDIMSDYREAGKRLYEKRLRQGIQEGVSSQE